MKKTVMQKYARLLARKGLGIQKGQEVIIQAELDQRAVPPTRRAASACQMFSAMWSVPPR